MYRLSWSPYPLSNQHAPGVHALNSATLSNEWHHARADVECGSDYSWVPTTNEQTGPTHGGYGHESQLTFRDSPYI